MKLKIFITLLALTAASNSLSMSNNKSMSLEYQIGLALLYAKTALKCMELEKDKTPESDKALAEFKNCFKNPEHVVTDQTSKELLKGFLQSNGTIYPLHAALMQQCPLPERTEPKTAPATDHCNLM